ncbi:zinc finger C3HC-type protein 1-like [Ptychodera flava]|uniref:zinc finger C3HC-type protein 1-like n=1 Tax=Ptychodera flava TaxID=63121 RepID=UPI00396A6647
MGKLFAFDRLIWLFTTMAENSKTQYTPGPMKALLSSFIHKDAKAERTTASLGSNEDTQEKNEGESFRLYQPWNKKAYFARVATFSEKTWFAKPIGLSPLRCAQYGWENTGKELLKCVSCSEILCGSLPQTWESELYRKRCEELKQTLRKAHSNICAWADAPSPDSFLSMYTISNSDALHDFQTRSSSLSQLKTNLPKLDLQTIEHVISGEKINIVEDTFVEISQEKRKPQDDSCSSVTTSTAIWLSLCGWNTSSRDSSRGHILTCHHCNRQAGLWNFTRLQNNDHDSAGSSLSPDPDTITEPKRKRSKFEDVQPKLFNPITEHRFWCPMVKAQTFVSETSPLSNTLGMEFKTPPKSMENICGWQAYLSFLLPSASPIKASEQRTSDKEQLCQTPRNQAWKAVRKVFKLFQSEKKQN